jgi:hypothetical protein
LKYAIHTLSFSCSSLKFIVLKALINTRGTYIKMATDANRFELDKNFSKENITRCLSHMIG